MLNVWNAFSSSDEEVQEMGDFDDLGDVVVDVVVAMLLLPVFFYECEKKPSKMTFCEPNLAER